MIRLSMVGPSANATVAAASSYFRVTGGVVWVRPQDGAVTTYEQGGWRHRDVLWSGMRFEGQCRLVLGLPREPVSISEVLQSISVAGRVLSANGIPIALYDDARQTWHGVTADSWWPAFRVEVAHLRQPLPKSTPLGDIMYLPDGFKDPQAVST